MSSSTPGRDRLSSLGTQARRHVVDRITVRRRLRRVRARGWFLAQNALAATLAWFIAAELLDKPQPFFAPVAALICLGMSYGQRLRRAVEVLVGVAVGVGVGDVFVNLAGVGPWQIALAVGVAMTVAVFLSGSGLVITQSGVQAVIITTLVPAAGSGGTTGIGVSRWLDAMIGGLVALAIATVAPSGPLVRPREDAADIVRDMADVLDQLVSSARDGDAGRAADALERARRSEAALAGLRTATAEGLAAARLSPMRRPHLEPLRAVDQMADPLDHAMRNVRVLARRVVAAMSFGERVPERYLALLDEIVRNTNAFADRVADDGSMEEVRAGLATLAAQTSTFPASGSLTAQVVLAQTRSIVVDLLEATSLSYEEAAALFGPPNLPSSATGPPARAPEPRPVDDA